MVNIFTPSGRIGRLAYTLYFLLLISPLFMLDIFKIRNSTTTILLQFIFVYCFYMISIKRIHDFNVSVWHILAIGMIIAIPLFISYETPDLKWLSTLSKILHFLWTISLIFSLFFLKGTNGPNKYGEVPVMTIKFIQKIKNTKKSEKTAPKDNIGDKEMIFGKKSKKEEFNLYLYSKSYYNLPYLCILDFIRIVNESQDKNDDFLRGFISGYILGSKDAMSQSYFMHKEKNVSQAVADIPILEIMRELLQNVKIFQPDISTIEALKVMQTGMISNKNKYSEPEMYMLKTITFVEYVSQMHKNNSYRGLIYGYIASAKDMITHASQDNLNKKNRIANIEIEKICQFVIGKFNEHKGECEEWIVHPLVLDAIYKL